MVYRRLDEVRDQVTARLAAVLRTAGGTNQARVEREDVHRRLAERLGQLNAAERGLCFGRLDMRDGERRYIGRIGLHDDSADPEPVLIDWRAPAARPFYVATAVSPHDVRRRRHIRVQARTVVEVHDELLDLADAADAADAQSGVTGEAALLAALDAGRTGQMTDIVQTIQAEQDEVIRASHAGVLVVQGGPGTGKTAVALHRAAYLLYARREQLARRVVLVIGPNPTFLRYIGNVLPSLGETSVLLATVGELYPGVTANLAESPLATEVKGRLEMADVVAAALADRQWVPDEALAVDYEGRTLLLARETCVRIRARARESRLPHNAVRPLVIREITAALAREYADRIRADLALDTLEIGEFDDEFVNPEAGELEVDDLELESIRQEMLTAPAVRDALDRLWPALTPQRLLSDLFAAPQRIASAAEQFSEDDRRALYRAPAAGWSAADIPLLDEAAELLGEDDSAERARRAREHQERLAYAQGVLDVAMGSRSPDLEAGEESLTAVDVIDAARLAERHAESDPRTAAERAAADRTWTFGHVIVDEAQELSPMAWRLLMRRCPARSMTIVGDTAQTGDPAGTASWGRVLDPYVPGRWRLRELTLNYRVPAEIMAVAAAVLAEIDPALRPPRSVRSTGAEPWRLRVAPDELAERLGELVVRQEAVLAGRRLAVLVPAAELARLGAAIVDAVPGAALGEDPEQAPPVVVLDVRQAKGLEFDVVLIAEPARILAESPRGLNDLYVALTRATQRLGVVHSEPLPAMLAGPAGLAHEPGRGDGGAGW
jgi:DNA helicase IV